MSNKKILQGHNKALESLATIAGIPLPAITDLLSEIDCTKYEQGSFTLSEDKSAGTHIVNHSMGVVPKYYIVWTSETGTMIGYIKALVGIVATAGKNSASIYIRTTGYIGSYGDGGADKNSETQCDLFVPSAGTLIGGATYNYLLLG